MYVAAPCLSVVLGSHVPEPLGWAGKVGWGDPKVFQVGVSTGSKPLRGRHEEQVQGECSILG